MRAHQFMEAAASKLVIFDIDDTLVKTDTRVNVVRDGRVVHSLDSHEFTHYKLKPGEEFDFGRFRDAQEFFTQAQPIPGMIDQLKQDISTGNKVIMVTARADFNDREVFLDTFRRFGIDMSKVHVYRAGNLNIPATTEEKKRIIIGHLLGKEHYDKVIMYDDSVPNLNAFLSLKQDYPWSKFYAWHVDRDGNASEYHRTDLSEEYAAEMALAKYQPMGDFEKPGPFRGPDKKLVPHETNQLKTAKFFEQTPYDFRLFFSNIPGTGRYSEYGPMEPGVVRQIFGKYADDIIADSEDAITVVFVGNKGDSKRMLTPWIMAHRFGHAIQSGVRGKQVWSAWGEAEKHFFTTVNSMLEECYGKVDRSARHDGGSMRWNMTPEYNALFNAIGTQRSSRSGEIRRPYEFLYEIFAQYLGTGKVTFNPLPANLGYGRRAWGTPTKYLNIKPEFRDENTRAEESDRLARDMEYMFADVLSSSVGKIYVM